MEQPKVDFVELKLDDIVTSSPGSSVAFCQKAGDDYEWCHTAPAGTSYNYPENLENCGGNLDEFDY